MIVRKYNGYELGIWFFNDKVTGQPSELLLGAAEGAATLGRRSAKIWRKLFHYLVQAMKFTFEGKISFFVGNSSFTKSVYEPFSLTNHICLLLQFAF
jgi:hypothetical protein